jgi:mono/diheme cytochrome c family protein
MAGLTAAAFATAAAGDPPKASTGAYSAAQAGRGEALYSARCAQCHGAALEGADVAPALSGPAFLGNWTGQPLAALAGRIRTTMPQDDPGSLGLAAAADVTAYILQVNGYPAGAADLPADLKTLELEPPPADR